MVQRRPQHLHSSHRKHRHREHILEIGRYLRQFEEFKRKERNVKISDDEYMLAVYNYYD